MENIGLLVLFHNYLDPAQKIAAYTGPSILPAESIKKPTKQENIIEKKHKMSQMAAKIKHALWKPGNLQVFF